MSEVFAIGARASEVVHTADRVARLTEALRDLSTRCGSCEHWLRKECQREGNFNGRKFGPSAGALACPSFVAASWVAAKAESIRADLAALQPKPDGE